MSQTPAISSGPTAVPVGRTSTRRATLSVLGQQQAGVGKLGAVRLHPVAARPKVAAGQDVLRVEYLEQLVAGEARLYLVHLDHDVLEVAAFAFVVGQQAEPGTARGVPGKRGSCGGCGRRTRRGLQRRQAHGRRDFAHLAVGADVDHVVVAGEAEVLHEPDLPGQIVVIGDHRAALEGVHELGGVEAEHLAVAKAADHRAPMRQPKAWEASKRSRSPRRRRDPPASPRRTGRPHRWTPMIPVVLGVIIASTCSGSRLWVPGSMSQKTGVISCHCSEWAVAMKVKEGTITSPFKPRARMAISRATVPLHMAMQCRTPRKSASAARTPGQTGRCWSASDFQASAAPVPGTAPGCRYSGARREGAQESAVCLPARPGDSLHSPGSNLGIPSWNYGQFCPVGATIKKSPTGATTYLVI